MTVFSRIAGAAALLSAAAMAATPASATPLPQAAVGTGVPALGAWNGDSVNADQYRRYRRHRGGIDAGDVIAGVVILGGIAAIASAASRESRDRDYRYRTRGYPYPDYRDRPYQYRPYRGDPRSMDANGINRAIDACVGEVERDRRIESVDSVDRLTDGWRVEGAVAGGEGFTCRIGNDGRIDGIDYGQRRWDGAYGDPETGEDRQWDDEAYAQARRDHDAQGAQPAYPGGPVDGDLDHGEDDDGRYQTAQAPDFGA